MSKLLIALVQIFCVIPILGAKNFVLISAPGSGKGTFSQYLIQNHGYIQVCPGDIFRREINSLTELGKKIKPVVEKGEYVDEDIVCQMIADNLLKIIEQGKPFIVDGFPRSHISFQFLYKFFKERNLMSAVCFLQFLANDNTCVSRIAGRQICTQCCKVYNLVSAQPKELNRCDDCGIELSVRNADTQDITKNRLEYFHRNVEPLIESAIEHYEVKKIETECSIQELQTKYKEIIE